MNQISTVSSTLDPCIISAWIAPGHGFVNINCGEIANQTIGFYPTSGQNVLEDINARIQRVADFEYDILRTAIGGAANFKTTSCEKQFLGGTSLHYSPSLGRMLGSVFSPSISAKLPGPGALSSSSIAELASYNALYIPALKNAINEFQQDNRHTAQLVDDQHVLENCVNKEIPCLASHVELTQEEGKKVWSKVYNYASDMIHNTATICYPKIKKFYLTEECPAGFFETTYQLFGRNCIDFMSAVMDQTGKNWKEKLAYTYPPEFLHKMTGIAWHYLNWR